MTPTSIPLAPHHGATRHGAPRHGAPRHSAPAALPTAPARGPRTRSALGFGWSSLVAAGLALSVGACSEDHGPPCGDHGELFADDVGRYCAYIVVIGGFECPAGLPFRIEIEDAAVCADRDVDRDGLPADVCRHLGDRCDRAGTTDGGVALDGGPAGGSDGSSPTDGAMGCADAGLPFLCCAGGVEVDAVCLAGELTCGGDARMAPADRGCSFACGTETCTADQVCVQPCACGAHPTCDPAPDGGVCPTGTIDCIDERTSMAGCEYDCAPPPPYCAPLPRACDTAPSCGCFDADPCGIGGGGACEDVSFGVETQVLCLCA